MHRYLTKANHRAAACSAVIATLITITGCAPWASYPPVETTASLARPSFEPFPTLMGRAAAYGHDTWGTIDEGIVFNLPPDTPASVYETVTKRINYAYSGKPNAPSVRPMQEGDPQAYHITSVRVRGTDAEVDLIYPRADGIPELVTIQFSKRFAGGYDVERIRPWRIRIDAPMATYDDALRREMESKNPKKAPMADDSEAVGTEPVPSP